MSNVAQAITRLRLNALGLELGCFVPEMELGDLVDAREVLGGKQITLVAEIAGLAIDDEFVGHAAGLGTLAAVRAALTERLAREALPRVGDAEGAMYESLEFHGTRRIRMK